MASASSSMLVMVRCGISWYSASSRSARVVGEQQSRGSGQQRRDVAVNAGAEGELVLRKVFEPGLRIQEEPDAI